MSRDEEPKTGAPKTGEPMKVLLARLDGVMDDAPNPLQPKRLAVAGGAGSNELEAAAHGGKVIALPRPAGLHAVQTGRLAQALPRRWYHNNAALIGAAVLVSVAVSAPLLLMLSYQFSAAPGPSWKSRTAVAVSSSGVERLHADPASASRMEAVWDLLQTPPKDRKALPQSSFADAVGRPRLISPPVQVRSSTGDEASVPPRSDPGKMKLPRVLVPAETKVRAGGAHRLRVAFDPAPLVPEGSFVMISGLPAGYRISGGQTRTSGFWIVEPAALADAMIVVPATASGRKEITIELVSIKGATINRARTMLLVSP